VGCHEESLLVAVSEGLVLTPISEREFLGESSENYLEYLISPGQRQQPKKANDC
jgi:hypothetical protein